MECKIMEIKTKSSKLSLIALSCAALLVGCSDGDDGADGVDGVVGVDIGSTSTVMAEFTSATVTEGVVTVGFNLENANGVAVLGLTKDYDLRFGIAQLAQVSETIDEVEYNRGYQWQAYINVLKQPGDLPDDTTGLIPSPQYQANVEAASNCEDCFVDNGDGSYSYSFMQNIANVTEPLAVTYGEDNTHRATLELKLPQATANAHHDWQPSSGETSGIQTRNVVNITACYTCHQPESLELHGGRRVDLENCASCHTATSGDPESGNSVDFTYMIHAIHKGQDRETSTPEGSVPAPYKIVGYGGSLHDYGKVTFPQKPAANCASCHVEGDGAPANADLFKADLSNTACVGCHTEKPSQSHSSTNCVSCHNATDTYRGTGNAEKRHGDVLKAYTDAEAMGVTFSNIGLDTAGKLMFDVQITDATGAAIAGEFINQGTRVVVAWDSDRDFPAYTDASYSLRRFKLQDGTYDAATKTFSIVASTFDMPADADGKTFELWSAVEVCFNNGGYAVAEVVMTACSDNTRSVAVKELPYHFVWSGSGVDDGTQAAMRRSIIDAAKCQGCHNQENHHYNNGYNCQTCHTSDKTTKGDDSFPGGMKPTSFAYKAHEAEGHYLKYAGVQSGTVLKTDCSTCHTDDGIQLGRATDRVWRYGDTTTGVDIWVSSDAGACLSCHQKYLSDSGASHITSNGGILDGMDAADVRTRSAEACSTCHNPSQLLEIHGN
ncbi:OmcA/MtrC family decaheme c-type cytochrome [Shewanella gelidimarina]|uniref:OmcA/MtrC family decaheme c-type cytochrome n=1 Tax=Shewanella gelidimarina TaxID=56813 RepID=UPI003D160E75